MNNVSRLTNGDSLDSVKNTIILNTSVDLLDLVTNTLMLNSSVDFILSSKRFDGSLL